MGEKLGAGEGAWKQATGYQSACHCSTAPTPLLTEQLGSLFSPELSFLCLFCHKLGGAVAD